MVGASVTVVVELIFAARRACQVEAAECGCEYCALVVGVDVAGK
jgi:hypothetical protein